MVGNECETQHAHQTSSAQPLRVVVMASGSGTLLQAILDNQGHYTVCGVVTDVACPANERAENTGVPTQVVAFAEQPDRQLWNQQLAQAVQEYHPDIVVSAGFMRILGAPFLEVFGGRIINTHPALLPSFPGAHGVRDALAYGVKVTGSTVHFVDAGVDTGQIIAQEPVKVLRGETEAELHERIKQVERQLIVNVLNSATVVMDAETTTGEVQFTHE